MLENISLDILKDISSDTLKGWQEMARMEVDQQNVSDYQRVSTTEKRNRFNFYRLLNANFAKVICSINLIKLAQN